MLHLHTYCYRITIRINAYDHSYFLKTNGSESLLKGVNPIGQNLMPLINSEKYIKNCLSQKCAFLNFKTNPSLNFRSAATLNFSTPTVEDRVLEMLIIASIQTLKRGNKKCGKDEVFRLFRDSVDYFTKETFDKLLKLLIQNHSVRLNIIGNRECLSLSKEKENQKLRESDENQEKPVLMEDI